MRGPRDTGVAYGPRGRHRPPRGVRDSRTGRQLGPRGGAAPLRAQGLPEAQLCDAQGVALRERWRCRIERTTSPCPAQHPKPSLALTLAVHNPERYGYPLFGGPSRSRSGRGYRPLSMRIQRPAADMFSLSLQVVGKNVSSSKRACVGRVVLLTFCSTYLLLLGNAAFALLPLCVARDLGWCDHDNPRWGAHNASDSTLLHPRARRTGFYHRVGAPTGPPLGAPTLRFAPPRCPKPSSALPPVAGAEYSTIWASPRRRSWSIGVGLCCPSERVLAAFFHELTIAAEVAE